MSLGEYTGAGSGVTKGLYHLSGNSNDSSGNSTNGTDTAITYSLANGRFGQGASGNGTTSEIELTNLASVFSGNNNYTISLRFYPPTGMSTYSECFSATVSQGWTAGSGELAVRFETPKYYFVLALYSGGGFKYEIPIQYDKWNCITITADGQTRKIYLNGSLVSSNSFNNTYNFAYFNLMNTASNTIGYRGLESGQKLDEVIAENVVWSPEKVKKYFTFSKGRFGNI